MREKLTLKKVPKAVIDSIIEYLISKKFLDDRSFAKNWIRYRQARPFGPQRIRLELRQKGIDEEIIVKELSAAFDGLDQEEVVTELASRRAVRYRAEDPIKRKKKVFDFLARRGFSLDMIKKAIKSI
jgi:regulatory protein